MDFKELFRRVQSEDKDSLTHEFLFLDDYFKQRELSHINSNLREHIKTYAEFLIELYQQIGKDYSKIFNIAEFDEYRKRSYFEALNLAKKVKDPRTSNEELALIFAAIRKDLDFFIERVEKEEALNPETVEKIRLARALGDRFFAT